MLQSYHCEVCGSSPDVFRKDFFNWESASLFIAEKPNEALKGHLVHSFSYHNGIEVCNSKLILINNFLCVL